jgi:hypothetical protein
VIEAQFETPQSLYSGAAKAGFVEGISQKTSSNSVVSRSTVLISFAANAMVELDL